MDYCTSIKSRLWEHGIRVEINNKDEKLGKKIWQLRELQVPYILIVGDTEVENKKVAVRSISKGDLGQLAFEDLKNSLIDEITGKL
jgi:threonyl-tRNA synthetase